MFPVEVPVEPVELVDPPETEGPPPTTAAAKLLCTANNENAISIMAIFFIFIFLLS